MEGRGGRGCVSGMEGTDGYGGGGDVRVGWRGGMDKEGGGGGRGVRVGWRGGMDKERGKWGGMRVGRRGGVDRGAAPGGALWGTRDAATVNARTQEAIQAKHSIKFLG